jgi:Zn finger protein HypA/HybF involved in hydrogenase expression
MAIIENSGARLQTQADLGRTSSGRCLREGMAELSKAAVGGQDKPLADCRGCAFLSSSDDFAAGCPNCGCKDFDLVETGEQSTNGGH